MQFKRKVLTYSVAAALAVLSGNVAASGFALLEQNASGLGNAYAGGAAVAEDASTIFYNPAGMSRLSGKEIVVGVAGIKPSAKFSGTATGLAPFQNAGTDTGGDAGSLSYVPDAYFSMEINPQTHIGLGLNAPFGLQTEYNSTWMGRFQSIKSKLQTVNLNPSASYQVNDTVSIGAGLKYQRINGELSSAVNVPAAVYGAQLAAGASVAAAAAAATPLANVEGVSTVSGSDSAWGFNLGALFNISPQTRVGLAYRSSINYNLSGSVSFTGVPAPLAASFTNQPVFLALKMPESFSVSVFHQMSDKWDAMADASRTGWSSLQQLNVLKANGTSLSTTPENWKDTWRVSAGANYHYSSQWTSRVGIAYDQTPTSDTYRTPRIPDGSRTWLSLGGQYKPTRESAVDFGYAHLFVSNVPINQTVAGAGTLNGSFSDSVDILNVQYTHSF